MSQQVFNLVDLQCPLLLVQIKLLIKQHYADLPFSCLVRQASVMTDLNKVKAKLKVDIDAVDDEQGLLLTISATNS